MNTSKTVSFYCTKKNVNLIKCHMSDNNKDIIPTKTYLDDYLLSKIPSIRDVTHKMDIDDLHMIDSLYQSIIKPLNYLPLADMETIRLALVVSYMAHYNQKRESGELYIMHPIAVATILADSQVDCITIQSALLHDVVEDSQVTLEEMESIFGPYVKNIVSGVTKVSTLSHSSTKQIPIMEELLDKKTRRNENLRNLFISMSDDWRIILVTLADRIHNMRTLFHLSPENQLKIAKETMEIYAPLAHRIGIWTYVTELEDLSFKYLYPSAHKSTFEAINNRNISYQKYIIDATKIIKHNLEQDTNLDCVIEGRTKSIYSTWKKANRYNCEIEHIHDIIALRIIIDTNDNDSLIECYKVLGIVHKLWTPVSRSFKDYINTPKPNGYQSLHTTVLINVNSPLEIQIRTKQMHHIATFGSAAHWTYKSEERSLSWLKIVKEWGEKIECANKFIELIRNELLGTQIFVFAPNGEILSLRKGDCILDVIHGPLLYRMKKGRSLTINGKARNLSYCFRNGDIIGFLDNELSSTRLLNY